MEADLHRETAFVWLVKWLAKQDEEAKMQILAANPEENYQNVYKMQGMRSLIESAFEAIEEIRNVNQRDE